MSALTPRCEACGCGLSSTEVNLCTADRTRAADAERSRRQVRCQHQVSGLTGKCVKCDVQWWPPRSGEAFR